MTTNPTHSGSVWVLIYDHGYGETKSVEGVFATKDAAEAHAKADPATQWLAGAWEAVEHEVRRV